MFEKNPSVGWSIFDLASLFLMIFILVANIRSERPDWILTSLAGVVILLDVCLVYRDWAWCSTEDEDEEISENS